jgi:predicted nucleic acid-binding protein
VILVDTNVLLDVVTDDPKWAEWSQHRLEAASLSSRLAINGVIYAELSTRFGRIEDLDAMLESAGATLVEIPRQALFLAGKAFLSYRKSGGARTGVLPDFFIGAHAAVAKVPLLTREPRRYRNYYPTAELIAPEG